MGLIVAQSWCHGNSTNRVIGFFFVSVCVCFLFFRISFGYLHLLRCRYSLLHVPNLHIARSVRGLFVLLFVLALARSNMYHVRTEHILLGLSCYL